MIEGGQLETDVKVCDKHKSDGAAEVAQAIFAHPGILDHVKRQLEPWGLELPSQGQITMRFYSLASIPVMRG